LARLGIPGKSQDFFFFFFNQRISIQKFLLYANEAAVTTVLAVAVAAAKEHLALKAIFCSGRSGLLEPENFLSLADQQSWEKLGFVED
jgi:hypothetical protein